MKTEILSAHTPELFTAAVRRAADLLAAGEAVALPTETVYGLAANAWDENAVAKIFQIKGRPANNPVIVHVASLAMARRCAREFPATAEKLAHSFWPGPLTLVVPRADAIPPIVTAGGRTVGVRWPAHPFIQAVIRQCNFPLAAPSANLSGRVSPTTAEHVRAQLDGKIPLIVDGGPSSVGLESTVLDVTVWPPEILRPGMIHAATLASVTGRIATRTANPESSTLRSPGLLRKHYAPRAKLILLHWRDEADLRRQLATLHLPPATCFVLAYAQIPAGPDFANVSVMPHEAEAFARALYAALHRCDEEGARTIVVEAPPDTPEWSAVADRLHRAAAD